MPWYVKPEQGVFSESPAIPSDATATPNPTSAVTIISFRTPITGNVKIDVFDALGNYVTSSVPGRRSAGSHAEAISLLHLPAGIYYARIQTVSGSQIIKLVKE